MYKREKRGHKKKYCFFCWGCDSSGCRVSQVCSSNPFISLPVSLGIHTNPNWRRNRTHYIKNEWRWWLLWWRRYESKNVFSWLAKIMYTWYINIIKLLHFSKKVSLYIWLHKRKSMVVELQILPTHLFIVDLYNLLYLLNIYFLNTLFTALAPLTSFPCSTTTTLPTNITAAITSFYILCISCCVHIKIYTLLVFDVQKDKLRG